jgi:predicted dehydrogenase
MKKRDFLKIGALGGLGIAGGLQSCKTDSGSASASVKHPEVLELARKKHNQSFNMSGYAAPKMDTVRIAYIGLGNRGSGAIRRIVNIANVEVKAVCDIRPEQAEKAKKFLEEKGHNPEVFSGSEDSWKAAIDRDDIDLVYICTPWSLHTPMSVYAMESGKHAAVEIPAALTLDECWQLVETSERTKKHCMMLENCCYGFFELLTLNMTRQGYFGEIVHVEGAYIHDLYDSLFAKEKRYDLWRLRENQKNGNLYPTHGFGPIAQIIDLNRGDQMDYLVSMSTNDFMKGPRAQKLAKEDPDFKEYEGKTFGGNMNTSIIRTHKGKTIMLQHDITSPRAYSRIHLVSGTEGAALQYPLPGKISKGHEWLSEEEFKKLEVQFEPPIVKRIGELAKKVGGHGGMDFLMDWRLIDCLRNGLPLDQDVYDAASWSCITALSNYSVSNRSASIEVPDFTGGAWKTNAPVDITMETGGNTAIKLV